MERYFFYRRLDTIKEPIGVGRFVNSAEALTYFSLNKNLTKDQFLSMFIIEEKA